MEKKKITCQKPDAPMTRRQGWAIFCMTKKDVRGAGLTRQEASDIISALKSGKEVKWPDGSKAKAKKSTKPAGDDVYAALLRNAEKAGEEAMEKLIASKKVAPMVVQQHQNPMDDSSKVVEEWIVPGGPCGFASIRVKCVNGPSRKFVAFLKRKGLAGDRNSFADWTKSDYYGGYMKSFTLIGGQSLAYKEAYARAYAKVLEKAGIDTWVWSRMD
jgi:hypothetical protein